MKRFPCLLVGFLAAALPLTSRAGTVVQFQTFLGVSQYLGEIDVELYDQDKPVTVNNFLRLITSGHYGGGNNGGGFFHRCVPNFVVQGGGYVTFDPFETNLFAAPYANVGVVANFGNITNEFGVGKFYSNVAGTIAMAKGSGPNSAASQFYFNLNNNTSLDNTNTAGGYTVFGHAFGNLSVLGFFAGYSPNAIVDLTKTEGVNPVSQNFTQLPCALLTTNAPPYDDLVYYTVQLLSVKVALGTNGVRQISWPSLSGLTNEVEYTTNLTSTWQLLYSTNGNGNVLTVPDSSTDKTRFYRIHVLY
jgi:peptidyl-prolyl cis-trans isomerase A (cyclophilin A)